MKNPAVLFYTSDFITGTLFMTNEEVGAYIRILCMQHQKGHLAEKDMKNICKSNEIFMQIKEHFKIDEKGLYFNKRMEEESDKRSKFVESRANNRKKKEKDMKKISKTYEKHMENENENINEIINYLNNICNTNYKSNSKKTITSIKARLNEGFTYNDFKIVISKKAKDWIGTDMEKYLRPETLFGTKFESYLNQKERELTTDDVAKTINWEEFY